MSAAPAPGPPASPRLASPVAAAEDALLLLRTGRPGMAERVLGTLPLLLLEAENVRLKARIAELETMLAQRRVLQGQLARLAPGFAELEVDAP